MTQSERERIANKIKMAFPGVSCSVSEWYFALGELEKIVHFENQESYKRGAREAAGKMATLIENNTGISELYGWLDTVKYVRDKIIFENQPSTPEKGTTK